MIIVKPDAKLMLQMGIPAYSDQDTIEINLDDFSAWYKAIYWRKEGGLVHYDSIPRLMREWLDSVLFMSTDLEAR